MYWGCYTLDVVLGVTDVHRETPRVQADGWSCVDIPAWSGWHHRTIWTLDHRSEIFQTTQVGSYNKLSCVIFEVNV